jgi:hypothetical protein
MMAVAGEFERNAAAENVIDRDHYRVVVSWSYAGRVDGVIDDRT